MTCAPEPRLTRIKAMLAAGRYCARVAIRAACPCVAATFMTNPTRDSPDITGDLLALLRAGGLAALRLGGRTLLPIVQGGMGVGISAHRLAGSVAALGGVGTISSVDLRRHHPDLMERTRELLPGDVATAACTARPTRRRSTPPTSRRCGARSAPRRRWHRATACWR